MPGGCVSIISTLSLHSCTIIQVPEFKLIPEKKKSEDFSRNSVIESCWRSSPTILEWIQVSVPCKREDIMLKTDLVTRKLWTVFNIDLINRVKDIPKHLDARRDLKISWSTRVVSDSFTCGGQIVTEQCRKHVSHTCKVFFQLSIQVALDQLSWIWITLK